MESGIYRFILKYSSRDQALLVLLSAAALPLLYMTLELPKTIVNDAIDGTEFPKLILGYSFEQIPYLLLLCGFFLALVIASGALKYFTSTYRYRVGDRLLRRLRYNMVERLLRFRSSEMRNMSSGQVVSMITAETSNLGYFIAEAFAVPSIALGTLCTIVLFMFMQNWMMGVAAIALYPVQIYLIPKIQRRINTLQRQEVQELRGISQRISDVVAGANEIHGHDTAQYELADFSKRFGTVFGYRVEMSSKRYVANILNQFFSQLTPFFFLSIGGYLVIVDQLSLGSLVAVLAAYKDMYSPWKDLIDYYQKSEDARVRYGQLKEFFGRSNLLDKSMIEDEPASEGFREGSLVVSNVVVEKDEGDRSINGASLQLKLPIHAAILGSGASGREEFARLLARQVFPHSGRVSVGEMDLSDLPDSITGRRIGYLGPQTYLGSGTLRDVLVYPLLSRPRTGSESIDRSVQDSPMDMTESIRAGNSSLDPDSDWIDFEAAGCSTPEELDARLVEILKMVDLDQEVYEIGLRRAICPTSQSSLAARLIDARKKLLHRLSDTGQNPLIESFDADTYNSHASIAENILFGTPVGPYFSIENLGQNEYMLEVIEQAGLTREFLDMGRKMALTGAEIFRDLPPGHDFFEQFSFIRSEDLPTFEAILRRVESQGIDNLAVKDRNMLMALPFKLVEARHHEALISQEIKDGLLAARRIFASNLPDEKRDCVQIFDIDSYNAASSVVDNILFGKLASTKAGSAASVGRLVSDIVDELELRDAITTIGLEYETGVGGSRLTPIQRQKVGLARCLVKRPDILILSEALSLLDIPAEEAILLNIKAEMAGRSLILFESNEDRRREFEKVLLMDQGRFVEHSEHPGETTESKPEAETAIAGETQHAGLNEMVTMLTDIPMFAGIDRSKLKLLVFASRRDHFDPGQVVFHQGEAGDCAYVIISGEVDVVLESAAGERTVATLSHNDLFGEMAMLTKLPRTTTIRARTSLVLLNLSRDVFLRLVEENNEIAISVMRVLTERLASTLHDYGTAMERQSGEEGD
jgi:ABC-type bacteriocin/lantibiotic exporter with double-glycine peptidase domain